MEAFSPTQTFYPTDHDWLARLNAVGPAQYAATRNHLLGAVTGLSPFFTHGFLSLCEAVTHIQSKTPLNPEDKLFAEFGWRSFFHHVWAYQGQAIFQDLRPGLPGIQYATHLPADIREGRTGLPVIDQAITTLYTTGYLHNHARMWLASYVIHLRHIHWKAGADWLYGHLLDGDLASNHLSWQWVASTFSSKPYLFNADNVHKYAPPTWGCKATPLDTTYQALEAMARGQNESGRMVFEALAQSPKQQALAIKEPELHATPPDALLLGLNCFGEIQQLEAIKNAEAIELVHAWALRSKSLAPVSTGKKFYRLGIIHLPAHQPWPWSRQRWAFVLKRMGEICNAVFIGNAENLKTILPGQVALYADRNPGNTETLNALLALKPQWCSAPPLLQEPGQFCSSFSKYYRLAGPAQKAG